MRARSPILDTGLRTVFHTMLLLSLYLLFAGHNQPGGGFVGGLLAGAAFVLGYVAGGSQEVRRITPLEPHLLLGSGLLLAVGTGMASVVGGRAFLQSAQLELHAPLLGVIKVGSVLAFDAGVYLVVVGLVLTVLRTLGVEEES